MIAYVQHITLTTGHQRRSQRAEISREAMDACEAALRAALAGESAPIPHTDCSLRAERRGRGLLATVLCGETPLVTLGIAAHSRGAEALWRELHDGALVVTDERVVAEEPWCAARLEIGVLSVPDAVAWLGDFERCLAWTWIERRSRITDGNGA